MATYYVDDGGSNTAPFDTWANASTSLSALDDAVALASGDIVYIGHDHVCQYTHSANRTIIGPNSGAPCQIISVTQGSSPPTYQASTTKQIDTTEGTYNLIITGRFAFFGISMYAGNLFFLSLNSQEDNLYFEDCRLNPNAGKETYLYGQCRFVNSVIDLTADGSTNRAAPVFQGGDKGSSTLQGVTFVNAGYRITCFMPGPHKFISSETDYSGFTRSGFRLFDLTTVSPDNHDGVVSNCKMPSTWLISNAGYGQSGKYAINNSADSDAPEKLYFADYPITVASSSAIYRTSGASFEGVNVSWLVTTAAGCSEGLRGRSPWIYGYISATGSKTFDVYITNDTADFTDAEVWLEVEYLGTADKAQWSMVTDQRATITTTAAAQDDDTTSTWVGTGPSFTYKQKLSVTATVAEEGQYRARVCVGVASIASSRYFYIDPKVTVS